MALTVAAPDTPTGRAPASSPAVTDPAARIAPHPALVAANRHALARGTRYAGDVAPAEAHALHVAGVARLVDVRTAEERKFVGYVPGSIHVPWLTGLTLQPNPRFVRELEAKVRRDEIVLLICRCGPRSAAAAAALAQSGFRTAFNVSEGFEGDLDEAGHRNSCGGWRYHGLPWIQD